MTDGRYERLRAAVVQVLDAEVGDDVVALRRLLMDALNEPGIAGKPTAGALAPPARQGHRRDTDEGLSQLASRSLHVPGSLSADETLHLTSCVLPGDHEGPCAEDEVEFVEAMERVA